MKGAIIFALSTTKKISSVTKVIAVIQFLFGCVDPPGCAEICPAFYPPEDYPFLRAGALRGADG